MSQEDPLLAEVLEPYKENCRYLRQVELHDSDPISVSGRFEIPESCYIDDTGHFNSVEFNICFNQLFYYLIARAVHENLFAAMRSWRMADFRRKQLPDMLITSFQSRFRRRIDPRRFSGSITMAGLSEHPMAPGTPPTLFARTTCRFWDLADGQAGGEVQVLITGRELDVTG